MVAQFIPPRLDTDDNIGFLVLDAGIMRVVMQEGVLAMSAEDIRSFAPETSVVPGMKLIRVHYNDELQQRSFYLVSREGSSIGQHWRSSTRLRARLEQWHAEHLDRVLVREGLIEDPHNEPPAPR